MGDDVCHNVMSLMNDFRLKACQAGGLYFGEATEPV